MKKRYRIILFVLIGITGVAMWIISQIHMTSAYRATDSRIIYSGRWFAKEIEDREVMVTLNQGAMFYIETEDCDSVELEFVQIHQWETPYYAYSVDGKEPVRKSIADGRIELPDTGIHKVRIIIDGITEHEDKWNSEIGVAFAGIHCNGKLRQASMDRDYVVFLGDSITEGVMTLGDVAVSDYNSATHAFPWYTAKDMDVEPYYIGYGGSGVVTEGSFSKSIDAVDYFSGERKISGTQYPPCSAIVLNVGTNDFDADSESFRDGYEELLKRLGELYPEVPIVCMIPFAQTHAEDIRCVVDRYENCYLVETEGWNVTFTEGIHPNDYGSQIIAQHLSGILKELL